MSVFANIFIFIFCTLISFLLVTILYFLTTKLICWWNCKIPIIKKSLFLAKLVFECILKISIEKIQKRIDEIKTKKITNAKKIGKFFSVDYKLNGQKYCLLTQVPDFPWLMTITDQDGFDRTKELEPYIGPDANFHGALLKPSDFGYSSLNILCLGCDPLERTFNAEEILVIDKKLKKQQLSSRKL